MRPFVLIGVALLAFALGVWTAPLIALAADREPQGHALKCIAQGRLCVGMKSEQVLSSMPENNFGGLIAVYCGFDRLGVDAKVAMKLADVIKGGCPGPRYVAQFSDGRRLTSVWVDNGTVVQLDRVPRHNLDL